MPHTANSQDSWTDPLTGQVFQDLTERERTIIHALNVAVAERDRYANALTPYVRRSLEAVDAAVATRDETVERETHNPWLAAVICDHLKSTGETCERCTPNEPDASEHTMPREARQAAIKRAAKIVRSDTTGFVSRARPRRDDTPIKTSIVRPEIENNDAL